MESKYDYVVFDIETTGLHPESDQICEIAAIGVKDGLPQGLFSTLVAIEGSMPEAAGRVNGITDDMLKGAPAIGDALVAAEAEIVLGADAVGVAGARAVVALKCRRLPTHGDAVRADDALAARLYLVEQVPEVGGG